MKKLKLLTLSSFLLLGLAMSLQSKTQEDVILLAEDLQGASPKVSLRMASTDTTTEVAETLYQAGEYAGTSMLRFATPVKGEITGLTYHVKIEGYNNNEYVESAVSTVYKSISAEEKVAYWSGTGLVYSEEEASEDWYWACYTIQFSTETYKNALVSAYVSVGEKESVSKSTTMNVADETVAKHNLPSLSWKGLLQNDVVGSLVFDDYSVVVSSGSEEHKLYLVENKDGELTFKDSEGRTLKAKYSSYATALSFTMKMGDEYVNGFGYKDGNGEHSVSFKAYAPAKSLEIVENNPGYGDYKYVVTESEDEWGLYESLYHIISTTYSTSEGTTSSNTTYTYYDRIQLQAKMEGAAGYAKLVTWESSDENVAKVDEKGLVRAVNGASGRVTITASNPEGVFSEIDIIVDEEIVATKISHGLTLNADGQLEMLPTETLDLGVKLTSTNGEPLNKEWTVSFENNAKSYVSVNTKLGTISASKVTDNGPVKVTLTSKGNANVKIAFEVVVKEPAEGAVPAALVGTWNGTDDNGEEFNFIVNSDGTAVYESVNYGVLYELTYSEEQTNGNDYAFIDSDGIKMFSLHNNDLWFYGESDYYTITFFGGYIEVTKN